MSNDPTTFLIGGNDTCGMDPPTLGRHTPVLPYVHRRYFENEFSRAVKLRFLAACLRTGFNVLDVKPELGDLPPQKRIARVNSCRPSLTVSFGYDSFGSASLFTDESGFTVSYGEKNPYRFQCKIFSEDMAFSLEKKAGLKQNSLCKEDDSFLCLSCCPSVLVKAGFMTNYEEAAKMLSAEFQTSVAEAAAEAVCMNLGVTYTERTDFGAYRPLSRGDLGNDVRLLQYMLSIDGFPLRPDGIFGASTAAALTDFQIANGLKADGTANERVYRRLLLSDPPSELAFGSSDSYVLDLQRRLRALLYPVKTSGAYDPDTENAVRLFQSEHSLKESGTADAETLAAIRAASPRPRLY